MSGKTDSEEGSSPVNLLFSNDSVCNRVSEPTDAGSELTKPLLFSERMTKEVSEPILDGSDPFSPMSLSNIPVTSLSVHSTPSQLSTQRPVAMIEEPALLQLQPIPAAMVAMLVDVIRSHSATTGPDPVFVVGAIVGTDVGVLLGALVVNTTVGIAVGIDVGANTGAAVGLVH